MPRTVPTDKARQGRRGGPVLLVLIAALALVAVAWAIAEFYGQATEPEGQTPVQTDNNETQ